MPPELSARPPPSAARIQPTKGNQDGDIGREAQRTETTTNPNPETRKVLASPSARLPACPPANRHSELQGQVLPWVQRPEHLRRRAQDGSEAPHVAVGHSVMPVSATRIHGRPQPLFPFQTNPENPIHSRRLPLLGKPHPHGIPQEKFCGQPWMTITLIRGKHRVTPKSLSLH